MMALGFSPVSMELWYKGALGEALHRSCHVALQMLSNFLLPGFSAAYALRCCAGRWERLAGEQPPGEV